MPNLTGLATVVLVSLTAPVIILLGSQNSSALGPFATLATTVGLLAAVATILRLLLPGRGNDGRGLLYYTCATFMWSSGADIGLKLEGNFNEVYSAQIEPYLATPMGRFIQVWNAFVNPLLYAVIIYKIDNGKDPRNVALYWCGCMLSGQFVLWVGALTGSYSGEVQWAILINVIFSAVPSWIFCRFLSTPRLDSTKVPESRSLQKSIVDVFLSFGLVAVSFFSLLRYFAALDSNFLSVTEYLKVEPSILEPSRFAFTWIICLAVYGIPLHIAFILGIWTTQKEWLQNLSTFYAGALLQGTFVYAAFWNPSSDEAYRIPQEHFSVVVGLNCGLVLISHLVMYRSLKTSSYSIKKSN